MELTPEQPATNGALLDERVSLRVICVSNEQGFLEAVFGVKGLEDICQRTLLFFRSS